MEYIPFLTQSFIGGVDLAGPASLPATKKNGAVCVRRFDCPSGPATFNEVFVQDGKVLGVPDTGKFADVRANGAPTGISYLTAAANLAAARIEEAARCGEGAVVQVKMAKTPSDVNLRIPEWAMRYITDNKRKVDVRGPVFLTVRGEIVD